MKKILFTFLLFTSILFPQEKRIMTIDDLWGMQRLGTFNISPDGKSVVFSASNYSMDLNKGNSDIYFINTDGTGLREIKSSDKSESEPAFRKEGKTLSYVFDGQVWTSDLNGINEVKITDIYTGASGYEWSPDGRKLLFVSSVYPDCTSDECNKTRDENKANSKVNASLFTELMYRHWDDWRGDKRSHLFLLDTETKEITDLTLMSPFDVPPIALGSSNDYSFSPDGNEVAFTMNTEKMLAISTNNDVFILKLDEIKPGERPKAKLISTSKGNDNQPVYSPDGKYIAYSSMARAGFEADKLNIILYDRSSGSSRNLTEQFELSAGQIIWSNDSRYIYFDAANQIYNSIYRLEVKSGKIEILLKEYTNTNLALSNDDKTLFFKQQRSNMPHELFAMDADGRNVRQITNLNSKRLAQLDMNPVETFWSDGAEGAKVQSIIVKPPFFDPGKKYPMIFLIHGGPQGHWNDEFHYRWNLQMFASQGYVVVAPNPRGSTGYGQKFTDEISGDWGGKAYTDLMNAYDYAIDNFEFIDGNNTFAAGASYGGYMINWIAGHNEKFNALVSHDGVFNLESMYGTTEELWFPEWEYGGTPWEKREVYEKWSPHRYIHNAKTPVLVIHGGKDFRVPEEQAFQLFTSLQRLGVESMFLYFPEETHFVQKPQNSRLWWKTVFDWYDKHYKRDVQ